MILLTDIANKMYELAKGIGISEVYQSNNTPFGEVLTPRVIVSVGMNARGSIWDRLTAVINVCIPDIDKNGTANLIQLGKQEKTAIALFSESQVYKIGDKWCEIELQNTSIEENTSLHCHYINLVFLVKTLNLE